MNTKKVIYHPFFMGMKITKTKRFKKKHKQIMKFFNLILISNHGT